MTLFGDTFARAQRQYENQMPPEPRECCEHWEDEDHDNEACWYDQAEAAAEAKAEQERDDRV